MGVVRDGRGDVDVDVNGNRKIKDLKAFSRLF